MNRRASFLLFLWLATGLSIGVVGYLTYRRSVEPAEFIRTPIKLPGNVG